MECESAGEGGHSRRLKIQRGTSWTWMIVGMMHTQHLAERRKVNIPVKAAAESLPTQTLTSRKAYTVNPSYSGPVADTKATESRKSPHG